MPRSTPRPRFSIQIVLIVGCLAAHASGQSPEPDGGAPPVDAEDTRAAEQELAKQAQQALLEAQLAQTEMHRLIAERRARLLSVKDDQARFAEELVEKQAELAAALEAALAWNRQVRELEDSRPEGSARGAEADRLYDALVHDLTQVRQNLSSALDAVGFEPSAVPIPQTTESDKIPLDIDDGSLAKLEKELVDAGSVLRAEESKLRWDRADTLGQAIVIMNKSRLRLLDMLSDARRESLEGFGYDGIAQVKREVHQMVLEARFNLLSLPREATERYQQLRSAPGPALAGLLELLFLILFFRWWRKRADTTLEELRRTWLQKRPQTAMTRGISTFAWYLRRIRKPLEWLLFFGILARIIARAGQVADTKYLHIVIRWLAVGAFVVQLIDATASRQGFSSESLDKLRFRSLRLVGVSVVVVGLSLSLTETAVGKGAIYAWVASTFWFLAIPIGLILVSWWREIIFERAKARGASRFLQWVAAHDHGLLMHPAAVLGGAYLLIEGVIGFFIRRVSELAPLRRLVTYQLRRGAQKSATSMPTERGTEPLPAYQLEAFAPGPPTAAGLVTSYMSDRVHAMRALVRSDKRAVVAIVGERGLGKTTFLGRVTGDLEPEVLCAVQCQPGGFPVLLAQFARVLELPEASTEEQILEALQKRAPRVIAVDDAQRLVRPLIGGLEDFDHLTRFMRLVSPEARWLIAIGKPAWHYIRRARGDRSAFDQVVDLKPWEEPQLAALIEQRTREAGIDPNFERLVVPRQVQTAPMSDEERTKRDFYRILLDYSDGNPEVALHWWKASLYRRPPDDTVHVRLFQGPTASQLDDLPSNFYFVLRSVIQLELAIERDVIACTDLSPAEVADALRAAWMRGYIEDRDGLYHVDITWYRAITGILRRKHLLFI